MSSGGGASDNEMEMMDMSSDEYETAPVSEVEIGMGRKAAWLTSKALRGHKLGRELGRGTLGTVYSCSLPDRKKLAVKLQVPDYSAEVEAETAQLMSDIGVGPRLVSSWVEEGVAFLVFEKWDMSLQDYQQRHGPAEISAELIEKMRGMIVKMHNAGYVHADILEKNVLVRLDEGGYINDWCLTDFGLTDTIKNWKRSREGVTTMYNYLTCVTNSSAAYFSVYHVSLEDVLKDPRHMDWAFMYHLGEKK